MSGAKKVTTITEQLPDEQDLSATEVLSEEEINLAAIRERYAPVGATYKIYKIVKGANPAWCGDSIDEIDESSIQQQYGGGKYAIRIFMDKRLRDTVYIDIAEPNITSKTSNMGDPMQVMVTMLNQQLQQTQQLLMAVIGRPAPLNNNPPTTINDTIALFTLLKNNQPLSGDSIVTKIVEKALDRLGEPGDGGDWKMELIKSVKEIAPPVITALASQGMKLPNMPMQPGMGMGVATGNPSLVTALDMPHSTAISIEAQQDNPMFEDIALKQAIAMVKPKILGGVLPPDLAIDWLLANAGDPMYQPFLKAALTKSIEDLIKTDPELGNPPFKEWFSQLLDGIKEEFKRESESQGPKQ